MIDSGKSCNVEGCEKPSRSRGMCEPHYRGFLRENKGNLPPIVHNRGCEVVGCPNPHSARGMCDNHYHFARNTGEVPAHGGRKCAIVGCSSPIDARHMCKTHYRAALSYGLTFIQMQWLYDTPCEICGEFREKMAVDHEHSCCPGAKSCGGCIRGRLCSQCNMAIGLLRENPKIISSAYLYIQKRKTSGTMESS